MAGKPVKDTSPVTVYAVPTDSDFVRVSSTNKADWTSTAYVWKRYGDLKDGEQYEVTTSDIEPGDVKASKASAWGFVPKITASIPVPISSDLAAGLTKVVTAARSIDARAAKGMTATLAADRKLIKDGLVSLIGVDLGKLTRTININPPRSLTINVVGLTLQVSWLAPVEAFGSVSYAVFVDGLQVATQATLSFTTNTLAAGLHSVDVYATDARGFRSVALTGTASIVLVGTTKWEGVGHGIGLAKTNSGGSDANLKATLDLIRFENNFKFVNFVTTWRVIEPTPGNYDWRYLDWMLAYLSNQGGVNSPTDGIVCPANQFAQPKYFWWEPWFMRFGVSSSGDFTFGTQALPQWVIDAGYTYVTGGTAFGDLRVPIVRDRFKAMQIAAAQRYANNPYYQGCNLTESAGQQRRADYQEIALAVKQAVPRNNYCVGHNFIADPYATGDAAFMNLMADNQIGLGGPDVKPRRVPLSDISNPGNAETFGQLSLRGAGAGQRPYGADPGNFGANDRRGQVPNFLQYQVKEDTSAEVYAWAEYMKCTHLAWWPEEGLSPDSYNWSGVNGIKATVNANPNRLWTTKPSSYP